MLGEAPDITVVTVAVKVTVDTAAWATEYGLTADSVAADVHDYVMQQVGECYAAQAKLITATEEG